MPKNKDEIIKEYELWDNVPDVAEIEDVSIEELIGEEYTK